MERKRQPNQSLNLELHLGLPPVEDLTPLNQSLITPEMACAFGIVPMPTACSTKSPRGRAREVDQPLKLFPEKSESDEYCKVRKRVEDSSGSDDCYSGGGDESGSSNRGAVKRPRLVWTPELHKRFVDVIDQLGVDKAVPKTIMEMMSVDGLTRENVASHLQKYRLYLKKADGNSNSNSISTTSTGGRSPTPTPTQTQKTTVFETGNGGLGPLPLPTGFHFNPMAMVPLLPPPPMLYGVGQFAGSGKLGFCGMESGGFTSSLLWNRHGG